MPHSPTQHSRISPLMLLSQRWCLPKLPNRTHQSLCGGSVNSGIALDGSWECSHSIINMYATLSKEGQMNYTWKTGHNVFIACTLFEMAVCPCIRMGCQELGCRDAPICTYASAVGLSGESTRARSDESLRQFSAMGGLRFEADNRTAVGKEDRQSSRAEADVSAQPVERRSAERRKPRGTRSQDAAPKLAGIPHSTRDAKNSGVHISPRVGDTCIRHSLARPPTVTSNSRSELSRVFVQASLDRSQLSVGVSNKATAEKGASRPPPAASLLSCAAFVVI